MKFKIIKEDGKARTGIVTTKHGNFHTPSFTPVATLASVRALDQEDLEKLDVEVILSNTYHLHLRPGDNIIKKFKGLHNFMNWHKPIITDSGGFQAFSLGYGMEHGVGKIANNIFPGKEEIEYKGEKWAKVTDKGVRFKNPLNGDKTELTPKISMEIQSNLGSDIIFAFDECTSPLSDKKYTKKALERTHKWAVECLKYRNKEQALFGIVQGGAFKDLRIKSSKFIGKLDFDGFGIGGSLGKTKQDMYKILEWVIPLLPKNKPRHLLGIGGVDDILNSVEKGVDMFDCVTPTRWGRRGHLFISPEEGGNMENKYKIIIKQNKYKDDKKSIDKSCNCYVCKNYSRAYLRHLHMSREWTYYKLASYHNEYFILNLMKEIRKSINNKTFKKLKKKWLK
ncbi:tRNA guanosine(34) transglycosylase Tgt [Candidatus Woesearchaeota archaeon B3_Woes]|nr:MAG: tRNA guanosine(34) transglycosylase Tgt [Candidatus Woesearchaeota archaeon B3_Woes]